MDGLALDPVVGRLVDDRYEVGARIARGGTATVYLAVDRRLERTVAVKVMHPHLAENAAFVARFRREAQAVARLSHPGVVAVHDQGMAGGTSYLVMEHVAGPTLRAFLARRGALPVGEALEMVRRVLEALACAHREGLVHRDVKPENVLLTPAGRPKVADFGLARAVTEATAASTGTVLGTVAYLAPEIVAEGRADARADVYAVGVMLYELITGSQPFAGESPIQVAYQHVHGRVPAPSGRVAWLPAEVDELIGALTARDPEERPADAGAALELLTRCVATLDPGTLTRRADVEPSEGTSGVASGPQAATEATDVDRRHGTVALPIGAIGPVPPPSRRRHRAWPRVLGTLLAVLVVAGAATAWWFTVGPGGQVEVPTLTGLTEDAAVAAARDAGLSPDVERTHDDAVPAGEVISTDPGAGAAVRDGSVLTLAVSRGVLMLTMPEVVGLEADAAGAAIEAEGLPVGEGTDVYHPTAPAGTVVATEPSAGTSVRHDTPVALQVSMGREPVEIPGVVGSPLAQARAALAEAGLAEGETAEAHSADVPEGAVISQDPGPGQAYRGDAVDLVVSLGPELVEVPDLVGTQVGGAVEKLEAAGLDVRVERVLGGIFGTVHSLDPGVGELVPKGSVVVVTVV